LNSSVRWKRSAERPKRKNKKRTRRKKKSSTQRRRQKKPSGNGRSSYVSKANSSKKINKPTR